MALIKEGRISHFVMAEPDSLRVWRRPVYWLGQVGMPESFSLLSRELDPGLERWSRGA